MPIYDFECASCGPFSVMRRIADREKPCRCPECGAQGGRVIGAPSLALMTGARRAAHATNERAAHAPRQSDDGPPLRHRAGCSCCSGGSAKLAGTASDGLKRPAGRPWMISH
ncbi:FmdB family zinc ribbon protein [Burkholderia seminalis]|uniref:FmdB family zinc ribbon protein n=1 Tax=Burkholderia seminalis TaxID=488731 RepID=UPI001454061E|nr:zinc ribbon domain-containing protein [Burkholderia seminalis]MCA8431187.1 zinc ribbon domain-containing protein [Burkholderia seminalis]VWB65321.1 FmdB family regulatory protein [Burkholderia seminalis]